MKRASIRSIVFASSLLFIAALPSNADDKGTYFAIGELDVPNFMSAVTDLGAFAEKVTPGTSMMLAGGAMALSFKYPGFDLNSGIRAIGYANSEDPLKKSRYTVILTPSGAVDIKDRFKTGKTTLFVKKLDGKVLLSNSMDFLNTFKKLPASPKFTTEIKGVAKGRKPIIYIKSLPAHFFDKAGDLLPSLKSLISQYPIGNTTLPTDAAASGDGKKTASENATETFFRQCDSIETRVYASQTALILHFTLTPSAGSKFQAAMKPLKGEMTYDALDDLVSKVIGDPAFRLSAQFDKTVDSLSGETGDKVDAKTLLATLPKLQFSARDSRMLVEFKLPPEILRAVLLEAGLIQKPENQRESQNSSSVDGSGSK
ncbi:MAG: hypothetical protein GXP32_03810 [Kiritimatiellaeota bacterium]|nr:hypothetical protein [Kiritimatiellota bacterium]